MISLPAFGPRRREREQTRLVLQARLDRLRAPGRGGWVPAGGPSTGPAVELSAVRPEVRSAATDDERDGDRWQDDESAPATAAAPRLDPGRGERRVSGLGASLRDRLPVRARSLLRAATPDAARGARFGIERGYAAILLTLTVVGLLVAAAVLMAARPRASEDVVVRPVALVSAKASGAPSTGGPAGASPRPASTKPPRTAGGTGTAAGSEPSPASSTDPGGRVVVDVTGKVGAPGVQRLPSGARVEDALRAAGGALPGVDLSALNLARVLVDGEQVAVGVPAAPGVPPATGGEAVGSGAGSDAGPVDLNTATLAQLDTLPGVGPVMAQRILDWRQQNGRFSSVDELREIEGVGEKTFARLAPKVRV